MATNSIQHKSDGLYYNGVKIGSGVSYINKTADYTLTSADCIGYTRFDNDGASGTVKFTLPDATVGYKVIFINTEDRELQIQCQPGDLIFTELEPGGVQTIFSTDKGTMFIVYATSSSEWYTEMIGDFSTISVPSPNGLQLTEFSPTQIDLSWTDNSTNEDGFKIERSLNGSTWTQIDTVGTNVTTYSDLNLTEGETYYYRVRAYQGTTDSNYSNVDSLTTTLPAPTVLGVTAVSDSQINLAWTDNATDETGFKIEKSLTGTSGWTQIDTVTANTTSYSDTAVNDGTTYYYRVRAYSTDANSNYSNVDNDTTPLATPTNLNAVSVSYSELDLSWTDNSGTEDGFKIERSLDGSSWTQIDTVGGNVTSYSETGLEDYTVYYYRVRAYKGALGSVYSNIDSVQTQVVGGGICCHGGYKKDYVWNGVDWEWRTENTSFMQKLITATNTWISCGYGEIARYDLASFRIDSKGYYVGGYNSDTLYSELNHNIQYTAGSGSDPGTWVTKAVGPARGNSVGVRVNNKGYIFGGAKYQYTTGEINNSEYVLDVWTWKTNIPYGAINALGFTYDNEGYRMGGYRTYYPGPTTEYFDYIYKYNPGTNTWVEWDSGGGKSYGGWAGTAPTQLDLASNKKAYQHYHGSQREYTVSTKTFVLKTGMTGSNLPGSWGTGSSASEHDIYYFGGTNGTAAQIVPWCMAYSYAGDSWISRASQIFGVVHSESQTL